MDKVGLYNYLCTLPNVSPKDDWWCATRCILCGDSKKNPYKKRMYINCDPTKPEDPVWFHCFNCNSSGILKQSMLEEIAEGASFDVIQSLRRINKAAFSDDGSKKINRFQNHKDSKVVFPQLQSVDYQITKYKYMCKERLGVMIPAEDFAMIKVVWSLKNFLGENHIELHDCEISPAILERDYIGFTSVRNEYILFRDVTNSNQYRWYKYNLFDMKGNLDSYYAVKNSVNPLSRDELHIIVAEGVFDTLGILYNLYDGVQGNNIFLSTANGAFINTIKYYLEKGIVGSNVIVDCYIDNDTRYDFKKLIKEVTPYVMKRSNVHIYHNTLQKDFGYPKSLIEREELFL